MENKLRSREWFGRKGKDGFIYRAWMKNQGIPDDEFRNKPVIGICNTWSELTPCNAHLRELSEAVKKGVWEAGGFPLEFPAISLGEPLMKPTAMLFRNLASMGVEECIRANPIDGVVLLCGCDKTTPSLVMGACSVDIPAIVVSGGAMLTGRYKGAGIGTSDLWRLNSDLKKGAISEEEMLAMESAMCRSQGHCAVMGTASSMACMVETLGLALPGNADIPAADSRRKVLAQVSGRRIVGLVHENMKMSDILTRQAFENAIMANAAIGGSTNFVIHLLAIAGRLNVPLTLSDFDDLSAGIPLLANLQPSGEFFMEDFFYAGGLQALLKELQEFLHLQLPTVNGKTIGENLGKAKSINKQVIASIDEPFNNSGALAILKGNLCEDGAVIKPSAASPHLLQHTGKALVFDNIEDYKERIDDPTLDVDETSVLVLKHVGLKGYPGMPEVGNMALPKKMLEKGVTDMVRISDGRMSGTGFGTVVLHVSPEAALGGNFSVVRTGDTISLDVPGRSLNVLLPAEELKERKEQLQKPKPVADRGYVNMFVQHVEQPHLGADLDFLKGGSGSEVSRDSH
ncbi:IlvD/Edd family dehydratase [Agriterribacter sp.]|uniref:IlvD/Edd family dehydratase n=1 Tax=Agriterribacter sp. TaxID=2821509 RepID=UPI002C886711|nr:IlvD/Edd family dehydratase [Agriterribacter sp.]HRP55330.1 IlvD/Edd family dehydratase [Agriterribacter sp.]